ncbi:cysteine desulfurase [Methanoregula sp.]|uniref:cysteine desulfurase n=1 Tax=Methanoregula sp. TaxID=2052170 RepID=UPI00236C05C4|nr:cysteine desulfurase [Methanoregula sp.]MDD1687279.1 cysteine desulfurase [Methanoregula sp.]
MIPADIRKDFALLSEVCYLDSAATSLSPEPVLEAMLDYERTSRANAGRGVHRIAQQASRKYRDAHQAVRNFINVREGEVVFTRNSTEAINAVAFGFPWQAGDQVIATLLEHHSNLLPWMRIRDRQGIDLRLLTPGQDGTLDPAALAEIITKKTRLVAISQASNVLGNVVPVAEFGKICHDYGALLLVDGSQSVPHIPVDVERMGCDFLCFSGHKMLGPTGTGVLYMKEPCLEPLFVGGGGVEKVTAAGYTLTTGYERYEAGTPNISGAIGLARAVEYLETLGMEKIRQHEEQVTTRIIDGLSGIENVQVFGPGPGGNRIGVVSFAIRGLNPHDVAVMLDGEADIMVRSGHHCCMPLMEHLNLPDGTVRASLHCYNTIEDADLLVDTIRIIAANF